jgi:hypothetical protein
MVKKLELGRKSQVRSSDAFLVQLCFALAAGWHFPEHAGYLMHP